jgi:hypothetical protein
MIGKVGSNSILRMQNRLSKQHLDYISITLTLAIIMLLSIISDNNRVILFNFIKSPIVISFILILCLIIGYFHFLSSMLILILLVFMFIRDNYNIDIKDMKDINTGHKEGFINKERMVELDEIDKDEGLKISDTKIKELFKPGFFGKRLQDIRDKNKAQYESTIANNKAMMALEKKKRRLRSTNDNRSHSKEKMTDIEDIEDIEDMEESFSDNLDDTKNGKQSTKAIIRRKFDPTNEEDSNLLLTMESCSDINDRIKYNYENKEYLKRYIRDKLEEIIELLHLVDDE